MSTGLLSIIGSALLIIIGLWCYVDRKAATKRALADEAKRNLDNAKKNDDTSGITAAADRINRL